VKWLQGHIARFWLAYVTLITGISASLYFYHTTAEQIRIREAGAFYQATSHFRQAMELRFSCYYNILNSLGAFYSRTNLPGNQEAHEFIAIQDLTSKDENLGLLDLGYYARFTASEKQQLLDVLIANGIPDSNLTRFSKTTDSDWLLVHWDDLKTNSLSALGSYVVNEPIRLSAMTKAASIASVACTEKTAILLGHNTIVSNGFVFFSPVYRSHPIPVQSEDRHKLVKGFVFASFGATDYWQRIYASASEPLVRFEVYDGREMRAEKLWFDSLEKVQALKIPVSYIPLYHETQHFRASGREWTFRYSALPHFGNPGQMRIPLFILIGGSLVSIGFFAMIQRLLSAYWHNHSLLQKVEIANRAIAKEKALFQVTFQSIGDGVITLDIDGLTVLMNPAAEIISGMSHKEAFGQSVDSVAVISTVDPVETFRYPLEIVHKTDEIWQSTNPLLLTPKNGACVPISLTISPMRDESAEVIGFVAVIRDIAEKQKLIEQQIKSSKLESIGILAGGIAHDFNNLLTAIMGNISLARFELKNSDPSDSMLSDAETACDHARSLTQQLLAFAKGGAPARKIIQLNDVIINTTRFSIQGSACRCEFDLPSDAWLVEADKTQIGQVIQNLVINAVEAMHQGGVIKIKVCNTALPAKNLHSLKPGRYLKISIQDQGVGIPMDQVDKIFDPYYSTKQRGSGLGLATAYFIVKRHDGALAVESSMGIGTRFDIYLPATEKVVEKPKTELAASAPSGSWRILVMDDDTAVINALSRMLNRLGHEVIQANEGQVAIDIYRDHLARNIKIDAAILDLIIPGGMGGLKTIQELLNIDPNINAIVSSGYSNDPVMADCQRFGFKIAIPKPYTMSVLSDSLARLQQREMP
jgi:PAS domain S-box-containing protein